MSHSVDLELIELRKTAEWSMLAKRADARDWQQAWRQRNRWDVRWQSQLVHELGHQHKRIALIPLVKEAKRAWGAGIFRKARQKLPSPEEVAANLQSQVDQEAFTKGAMAIYLSLAMTEAEDSGQSTLDALGMNETFAWASVADFPENLWAVRGSKILTKFYDNHLDRLAKMVVEKCNPGQPKTMGQLTKEIRNEWNVLTRKEAERIARTESAFVWETTNWNALQLNDVREVEWLIGTGPSIGPPKSYPVCDLCLEKAANSPYVMEDVQEIPPLHPHCRCTVIQKFNPEWLPPAEPWTGAKAPLQVFA